MVVVAPADHKFANRKSITLAELVKENFIVREHGSGTRVAVENVFAEAGQNINIRMELGSNEAIKQGVAAGLGISVLSLHTIVRGDLDELTVLDVDGSGNPNDNPRFRECLSGLYPVAFTLRFAIKAAEEVAYSVMPPQAL